VCHAIGGAGGKVGPDLTSIGASAQPDYLLESLLYPNAKVKEGYLSVAVTTKDGQEIGGVVVKEGDKELILRNAANVEVSISNQNIAKRTDIGSTHARRARGVAPARGAARSRRVSLDAGQIRRLRRSQRWRSPAVEALSGDQQKSAPRGGPRSSKVTSRSRTGCRSLRWSVAFCQKTRSRAGWRVPPTLGGLFAATQFESSKGGPVTFTLAGEAKEIWINGQTVKAATQFTAETRSGINTAIILLNRVASSRRSEAELPRRFLPY